MAELRISQGQGASGDLDAQRDADLFVFDDESDAVPVRRWQRGDIAPASIAIQRHEAMVYAATFRLLRNHALSEDISQDAFLRAHERIADLRQPAAFSGWVRQIAVRLATDELCKRPLVELSEDEPDTRPGPADTVETLDALEQFRARLDLLPAAQRAAIVLRDVEGFSIRETADQLGISEAAVKMRLSRARAVLVPRSADRIQVARLRWKRGRGGRGCGGPLRCAILDLTATEAYP